ncbi:C2 domain [Musa troglodytarum]|uniref:C2 domain n=1 Tax=Musa troglodytarum TaxID=320322 RepID=A0A9E7EFM4_9LILI|nr:C2 domain [Musa troglodytarum]
MGFVVGLLLGVVVGVGLVMAFVRSENTRSKSREQLAASVVAFARMTIEDSRKLLPAEFYPSWVLKWLNLELTKIWPYVNEAASELIRNSVEPVLEQYKPAILASLKFSKLTLGTVAPQFTGVSIIEEDKSGITMELELQWDGNPSIILDIRTRLGVALPVQKKLDFTLKVVGGDISSLPGISNALEGTIRDAIEDSITWPVRKIISILPGDYSDLELKPVGILEVKLVQASDLTNKDMIGKSDPFAVLYIRPLQDRMKTSKTINNDLHPIWNEHFEFIVEDASTQSLTVKIYDDEGLQPPEFIGCAQVKLKDLQPGKVKDVWLKLVKDLEVQRDKKDRGQVHLELLYCPYGMENEFTNPFASQNLSMTSLEKILKGSRNATEAADIDRTATKRKKEVIVRGVLSVTVISAKDLPVMDVMGKADPFVVIRMKKADTRNKTRVAS